jgi:Ca2+-binding RTX toxin-like protein
MTSTRTLFTTLAVCAGLAALPAAAAASTATSGGSTTTVTGTAASEPISFELGFDGRAKFSDSDAGPGCVPLYDDGTGADCPLGPGGVDIRAGAGDDVVKGAIMADPVAGGLIRVDLGDGQDSFDARELHGGYSVSGGTGNDTLEGSVDDDVLDGGPGNDKVDGLTGADTVRGGEGDDTLSGDAAGPRAPDVIDGGPGTDFADDWVPAGSGDPALSPAATVALDGAPDDGFPGEGDNVTSVERVHAGAALDYTGDDGANLATAAEVGASSTLRGLGGDDELVGTDRADRLDGGAGADTLRGGFGNDQITGGPGRDTIEGDRAGRCNEVHCDIDPGSAADTIDARDGEADTISCGPGPDRVLADAADAVASDCETVERAAGGSAGASAIAVVGSHRLATVLRKGLKVRITGEVARRIVKGRALRARKLVATGSRRADGRGVATITLRFSAKAKRTLRRATRVELRLLVGAQKGAVTLKR